MLELGQVVLGVRDLEAATRRMEAEGFSVQDGGVHPGLGTANRIIPLGGQYLELLGVVDESLASSNWYGRAFLDRIADGDRLVRWSLRTDRIEEIAGPLGLIPERRSRMRPDGRPPHWRAAGLQAAAEHGWLPFFMQWDDAADFPGALPATTRTGHAPSPGSSCPRRIRSASGAGCRAQRRPCGSRRARPDDLLSTRLAFGCTSNYHASP